ncbi:MAG TPA: chitobiase/beta-hexosaminidase C-terminal domain-containing protein, partial [Lacipirellulaceae bacterium]
MAVRRRKTEHTARPRRGRKKLAIERLEPRAMMAAQPVINEIFASNDGVIQDADGDYSDFIELYNAGDQPLDLAGWHLTDDDELLDKWEFPSVTLGAGQYLVVFASGKDRSIAGSQLHTNFALDADGDFLALVAPDGNTIASQFAPEFPQQFEDISYGIATDTTGTIVLGLGTSSKVLIPGGGSLGTTWTQSSFVPDGSWQTGPLGVGYSSLEEPPPSATLLQVDFDDRGVPGNTEPGFSSFVIGGSDGSTQTGSVSRSFGGVGVTLVNASTAPYDDRRRITPVDSGAFTDGQLLQDFVFSRDIGTGGLDVRIDGLEPGAIHTLTVWSFDSGSPGQRTSDWTTNGIAIDDYSVEGGTPPASNETYRFSFVVAANAQGQILLQGRKDESTSDFAVFLNALKLETGDTVSQPNSPALRVDFNDRTEGESGAANTEAGYATMSLDNNGATFDGMVVTLSAFGAATFDDRDRANPVDSGAFTLDQVYDDIIYTTGPAGSGMEILIEGLAPNVPYDLLLRSLDAFASGTRTSTWTEVSSGQAVTIASTYSFDGGVAPTSNDANAMRATLVSSPQGTLVLRGVQTTADRSVVVNAIELTRSGFGELVGTDVKAGMHLQNSSAYIRVPFAVADLPAVDQLLLDMNYDAGFVAYLNGQEVARRNAPTAAGVPPAFNASATIERASSEALAPETIDLTQFKHLLVQGSNNVLAIHGLNSAAADGDFLIAPELRAIAAGSQALRYFETPTPGAPNGTGVIDFTSPVTTSVSHGFYNAPFSLELATTTAGAQIYYTFDGSVPAPGNSAAALYSAPIIIDSTTVFRAAAVKEGFADSPAATETYIFLEDVLTQDPLANPNGLVYPTIWQANATADYKMDSRVVAQWNDNNPANDDFGIREALLSIPTMSIVMDHDDLWNPSTGIYPDATRRGDAWEKPGSIEYFDPASGAEFQFNVGVQMHGEASRDNVRLKKHSFRLLFNPRFDGPGRLNFPLFDNSNFDDINTVVMRASFTDSFATRTATGRYSPLDSTYTRDVWMRDMQRAMGSLSADSTYVHLYINGLYWGLYNPAERPDDAFLASHLGGNEEDWDIIRDFNELFRGERTTYDAMFALTRQMPGSPNPNAIYQQLQGRNADGTVNPSLPVYLDVENFIDYMILHLYAGAEDWPSHNWFAARNRVDPVTGFQFFVWDQEIVMDGRFRDRTENATNANTPGELFQLLRSSSEFRLRFADRVQKHLFNDGALTNERSQEVWQRRADQIEAAIIGESARWGDAREGEVVNIPPTTTIPLMTVDIWRNSIANVHDFQIPQSHSLALSGFADDGLFPSLVAPSFSQHGGTVPSGFNVSVTAPSGAIWYTLDGSDPRLPGGAVSPSAILYNGTPITITGTATIRARALSGSQWSPLNEARFATEVGNLRISEVHYNPANFPGVTDRQDIEFFEIVN